MKKTPVLDFYKKCLKDGDLGNMRNYPDMKSFGLCASFVGGIEEFDLLEPTFNDSSTTIRKNHCLAYWASNSVKPLHRQFTPLRQNIVLFIAAMRNEL